MRPTAIRICLALTLLTTSPISANNDVNTAQGLSSSQCIEFQSLPDRHEPLADRREAMARSIEQYQMQAEKALSIRAEIIRAYRDFQAKADNNEPLSGNDLLLMREGFAKVQEQRQIMLDTINRHVCWIDTKPPQDPQEAAIQVAGVAMSLSAALLLYDTYVTAISPYYDNASLRRQLNRSDKGFDLQAGALRLIYINYASVENRLKLRQGLEWLRTHQDIGDRDPIRGQRYLKALIDQSPSRSVADRMRPLREFFQGVGSLTRFSTDAMKLMKDESLNLSSLFFGNAVGLVETRRGKLYRQPGVRTQVRNSLRAGDILVEKTPFRLTDTFIPGHWGHAAVWVGTEDELKALKIWDHPVVQKHHNAIRNGNGVAEALRSGVELNSIDHFLNVDDLGVLRHASISDEQRARIILLTLRQIGKAYDFNFDAESTQRVFCSKLVYMAYGDLKWPTSRVMGRVTVSPDNIAALALGNGPLRIIMLYHDGEEVTDNQAQRMEQLMKGSMVASR